MNQNARPVDDRALRFAWGEYRRASKQAREMKRELNRRRLISLGLGVAGAIFGVLAAQFGDWAGGSSLPDRLPQVFALGSAISVAVVTYLGKDTLASEMQQGWVMARARAEALKSEAFTYLARVPPYGGPDRGTQLLEKTQSLLANDSVVRPVHLSDDELVARLPEDWLTPEDYVQLRAIDQASGFYRPKAAENEKNLKLTRTIGFFLGAIGVILGAIGAVIQDATWVAGWVAVIGTIGGAVVAFALASRYEYQALSYQAAARRLESLVAAWSNLPEPERQAAFPDLVRDCERAIADESSNWVVEWKSAVPATAAVPAGGT